MHLGFIALLTTILGFLGGTLVGALTDSPRTRDLISECQKELPRNEYCKLIAVPNKGE